MQLEKRRPRAPAEWLVCQGPAWQHIEAAESRCQHSHAV